MKTNWIKKALLAQQQSVGCWLTLGSTAVAEALAHCGFDWLLIDVEHAPNDTQDIASQSRAIDAACANGASVDVAVRVTWNDPALVKRAMDCGAQTIVFPAIETFEQARAAIASTRFPLADNGGIRGLAGLVRAGKYGLDPEYAFEANKQACAVLQIETALGVANVEEIASLDGADCLFIGPADLSASLGHLGDTKHPVVVAAIDRVIEVGRRAGKAVGIFAGSPQEAQFYCSRGISMISLHSDVAWLTKGASRALQEFRSVNHV